MLYMYVLCIYAVYLCVYISLEKHMEYIFISLVHEKQQTEPRSRLMSLSFEASAHAEWRLLCSFVVCFLAMFAASSEKQTFLPASACAQGRACRGLPRNSRNLLP